MSTSGNPLTQYGSGAYGNSPIETLGLGYYLALISSEYRNSPKFTQFLTALLKKLDDMANCYVQMEQTFDIDNAVGVQLDYLGAIVGAARTVGFQPAGGVSPILDDSTYRLYIKAKSAANAWDGTIDGLQMVWQTIFPGLRLIIQDNQDMTATIFVTGVFSSIVSDLITNGYIVPRPETVEYTYVLSDLPAFGFDRFDATISGWDTGKWI